MKRFFTSVLFATIFFAGTHTVHAALSESQIQAILNLISSFGADPQVVSNVSANLRGGAVGGTTVPIQSPQTGADTALFTRTFGVGTNGEDVRALQKILNADVLTRISSSGVGAPGNESTYFGALTQTALIAFQKKHGISPASGYFGPLTKAKVIEIARSSGGGGGVGNAPVPTNPTTPVQPVNPPVGGGGGGGGSTSGGGTGGGGGGGGGGSDEPRSTPDTTAPTISGINVGTIKSSSAIVAWTTDENATSHLVLGTNADPRIGGTRLEDDALKRSHSVLVSGLSPQTLYYFVVVSRDDARNIATSSVLSFTTAPSPLPPIDVDPPSTPTGFVVGAVDVNTATISWNASTDNKAVTGYKVRRDGVLIETVSGTTFLDAGLTPFTTYNYSISAFDEAGNESGTLTGSLTTLMARVAIPNMTPNGGTFRGSITVPIKTTTTGASIYYTLDGSAPSNTSTLYVNPITLTATTTVKAIAYKDGMRASTIKTVTFIEDTPVSTLASCPAWKNDLLKNPFNKNSIYHIPLASGVRYAGETDATTIAWKANNFGTFNIGCSLENFSYCNPNGHPIFVAPAGTPEFTVSRLTGTAFTLPKSLRIPVEAQLNISNSGGEDATIGIFYPDTNVAHILYKYSWATGTPVAQRTENFSVTGTGHPNAVGDPDVGTVAAGVGNWVGILRGHIVSTPGEEFNHRFKIAVSRKDNQNTTHILGRGFHLPANGTDGGILAGENLGPFSYGDIVALPQSVNIDSLGLSEPGKRFARAMQQYGVMIVDGGPNGIRTDQYVSRSDRDLIRTDFRVIWPMMRRVEDFTTDEHFNTAIATGKIGSGVPLGPNCAYDAL